MTAKPIMEPQNISKNTEIRTSTILLDGNNPETKRQEILGYFHNTFTQYESIFECLNDDNAFYTKANPLRHPLIFYYGHTAVFFINKLNVAGFMSSRIDTHIESMTATGVDEMSWDDLNDKHYDWPTVDAVKNYRNKTRDSIDSFIRSCDITLPINVGDPLWIIMMAIEHERIHLETTSVLIRELPIDLVRPHPIWSNICQESSYPPENELLPVEGGEIILGKNHNNEMPLVF